MTRKPIATDHLTDAEYDAIMRLVTDKRQALTSIADVMTSIDAETKSNSIDGKRNAQRKAMAARIELEDALDLLALRRRRLVAAAKGNPEGTPSEPFEIDELLLDFNPSGTTFTARRRARLLRLQLLEDDLMPVSSGVTRAIILKEQAAMAGYDYADAETDPITKIIETGSMSARDVDRLLDRREGGGGLRQGDVSKFILRLLTMIEAGRRAGSTYGVNGKIPETFWQMMSRAAASIAKEHNLRNAKGDLLTMTPSTIKSIATRQNTDDRGIFIKARAEAAQ